jgi:hypothetical protein
VGYLRLSNSWRLRPLDFLDPSHNNPATLFLWFIPVSQILKIKGVFHFHNLIPGMDTAVAKFARNAVVNKINLVLPFVIISKPTSIFVESSNFIYERIVTRQRLCRSFTLISCHASESAFAFVYLGTSDSNI